ncbi:hypothetical protein [Brevibacillus laterosporus]|uniref:hypothetical protein n=1 Tax=Brevibacillus laterosporus TaxID=1465 RepID=UPI000B061907
MNKDIVTNELIGGIFDRVATYKTDGTLHIEQTPEYVEGLGWKGHQAVTLQDWDEIVKLRDFLNGLSPIQARG